MKAIIRLLSLPLIHLLFGIRESRQLSRPRVFMDDEKTLSELLRSIR